MLRQRPQELLHEPADLLEEGQAVAHVGVGDRELAHEEGREAGLGQERREVLAGWGAAALPQAVADGPDDLLQLLVLRHLRGHHGLRVPRAARAGGARPAVVAVARARGPEGLAPVRARGLLPDLAPRQHGAQGALRQRLVLRPWVVPVGVRLVVGAQVQRHDLAEAAELRELALEGQEGAAWETLQVILLVLEVHACYALEELPDGEQEVLGSLEGAPAA